MSEEESEAINKLYNDLFYSYKVTNPLHVLDNALVAFDDELVGEFTRSLLNRRKYEWCQHVLKQRPQLISTHRFGSYKEQNMLQVAANSWNEPSIPGSMIFLLMAGAATVNDLSETGLTALDYVYNRIFVNDDIKLEAIRVLLRHGASVTIGCMWWVVGRREHWSATRLVMLVYYGVMLRFISDMPADVVRFVRGFLI
jgi:hypothetical protein